MSSSVLPSASCAYGFINTYLPATGTITVSCQVISNFPNFKFLKLLKLHGGNEAKESLFRTEENHAYKLPLKTFKFRISFNCFQEHCAKWQFFLSQTSLTISLCKDSLKHFSKEELQGFKWLWTVIMTIFRNLLNYNK